MCTGIELAMLASAAVAAGGTVMSANAQADAADANAELARREATAEEVAAQTQAEKIRRAGRLQVSEANAALAASGVDLGAGTPIRIGEEITRNAESDAWAAILTGNRRAGTARAQAGIDSWQGAATRTAGYVSGAGTLLAGGARAMGGNWIKPNSAPIVEKSRGVGEW